MTSARKNEAGNYLRLSYVGVEKKVKKGNTEGSVHAIFVCRHTGRANREKSELNGERGYRGRELDCPITDATGLVELTARTASRKSRKE